MSHESRLRLASLGATAAAVSHAGGTRALSKGKPAALLTYLSLAPGRRASRERLATLLWAEGSSEAARQNLRQTIHYIKRRLGEVLVADDDSVRLADRPQSDVETFTSAAAEERFADAVAAYTGDFVPDFAAPGAAAFEDWAELERRRLRATYIGCVEAVVRQALGSGKTGDAVALARRARELAAAEPATWRILLECLIAARDTIGIAATMAQLDAEVEREDLDPDPATRALMRTARRLIGGAEVEPVSAELSDRELAPDLIGRDEEFRALIDAWETTRRGKGRAILLTGAAGLGKTRILKDFEARLTSTRARSIFVGAHPGNRTIASSLAAQLAEALSGLPGAAAVSTGSASVLVGLSPLIATAFPGAEPDRATGEEALRRRASALGELVSVLSETNAIALLIDDAHWADGESLRLLGALRAHVERTKSLMVVAGRIPDDLRLHVGAVEEIALRPLDVAGVAEFLGRLASLPTEPWSRGFVPRLHEVTHGIPLLLIETLQRLVEAGELSRVDGTWHAPHGDLLATTLPLGSALQARLQSLDERDRVALVRLATLGRPLSRGYLKGDDEVPNWDAALAELERRSFVARAERTIAVWHDEVGRGVLDLAPPAERLAAHGWVSDTLLRFAASMPEFALAAWHALRSADDARLDGVWVAAVTFARRSGDGRALRDLAADVFPPEAGTHVVSRTMSRTPWRMRFTQRVKLLAAAAVLTVVASGAAAMFSRAESASVRLAFLDPKDTAAVLLVDIGVAEYWSEGDPIFARPGDVDGPIGALRSGGRAFWQPGRGSWITGITFRDSGGGDVAEFLPSGESRRILSDSADDYAPAPSPDGRMVAFSTRRFDRIEHQADLVYYDYRDSSLHRVTDTPEDESGIAWSPDGSRLAFARRYMTVNRDFSACVIQVNGRNERCDWPGLPPGATPIDWVSPRVLLVLVSAANTVYRIDVESERVELLGRAAGLVEPLYGTRMVLHRYLNAQSQGFVVGLAPLTAPLDVRPVTADGRGLPLMPLVVLRTREAPTHVERLEFEQRELRTTVDGGTAVRVTGIDGRGVQVPVYGLEFTLADSGIATVSSAGVLTPLGVGETWVHASAGGWRRDSVRLVVSSSASRTVLREDWARGISEQWRAFGTPWPSVAARHGSRALHPNGDGKFASGVYSARVFSTQDGVGADFRIQAPIRRNKMQTLALTFQSVGDTAALARWDHVTGYGDLGELVCGTGFPWAEGEIGRHRFSVAVGSGESQFGLKPPKPDFFAEVWHDVRVQLTADGRCALYIDGELIARTERPSQVPAQVRLIIVGASNEKPMLVGPVEVWEGVRLLGGR